MRLILTENVDSLGQIGDIVTVKGGYARNYLLPRGKAMIANENNKAQMDHQKRMLAKRKEKVLGEFKELASKINKVSVTVAKPVGEEEKIFGTVTNAELEELLAAEGLTISRKDIVIQEEIKKVGVYHADVKLHPEVEAKFKIWVVAQQ